MTAGDDISGASQKPELDVHGPQIGADQQPCNDLRLEFLRRVAGCVLAQLELPVAEAEDAERSDHERDRAGGGRQRQGALLVDAACLPWSHAPSR